MPNRDVANLLTNPEGLPLVAPSILAADFARLADECRASLDHGADLLHLDVMDGHFVPNLTMGPALCKSLRSALPTAFLDVHLMIMDPAAYVERFAKAGANHLTFHIEVVPEPDELARVIRTHGMTAGLAINPPTDVDLILPWLEWFDMILVMSVNPGFGGQAFMPDVLEKVRKIRPLLDASQRLEMDGGIAPATAPISRDAGCDVLVAGSAVFGTDDYERSMTEIRGAARAGAHGSACGR